MKKIYLIAGLWAALFTSKAQTTATFEDVDLQNVSFYNGADGKGGFLSGGIWFPNVYNAAWDYWSGFSVSNMKDTLTAGYENQYSAITGSGAEGSENFAVVHYPGELKIQFNEPSAMDGFFVTNAVYTYKSMLNGDGFSKKFGGPDGTDPDYLVLMVSGTDASGNITDTVKFYLADFRSDLPGEDYIVKDWVWMDLSALGVVNELRFYMKSSDTGSFGMNTPAYFCIDNFRLSDVTGFTDLFGNMHYELKVFPNPVKNLFTVKVPENSQSLKLFDDNGRLIYQESIWQRNLIDISALENQPAGLYFLTVLGENNVSSKKIIKY